MKKFVLSVLLVTALCGRAVADEGMWLLPYLQKLNIGDMKARGFRLSAKDIVDLNGHALKDAVVRFSVGCTGEVISAEGLMLTNHHCGYGTIQEHSSVEHDYLKNGFWAMTRREEIPSPGLSVTFMREMRDVTGLIVPKLPDDLDEEAREEAVERLIKEICNEAVPEGSTRQAEVVDLFGGNQYLLVIGERYDDVRLVGAPPQSIGKFGGETDNWMWPRHTGDFSLFRIYAAPDGTPANYAPENIPYKAPTHLKISLKGYEAHDFAMVIGFPGTTERYMTTREIDRKMQVSNPVRIRLRGLRQEAMMSSMRANDTVRIKYASKYAASSNYWKNSIGVNRGLARLNVRAQKGDLEARFRTWAAADPVRRAKYGDVLPLIERSMDRVTQPMRVRQYLDEGLLSGIEVVWIARLGRFLLRGDTAIRENALTQLRAEIDDAYKDYDMPTDRRIAKRMVALLRDSLAPDDLPAMIREIGGRFRVAGDEPVEGVPADVNRFIDRLYAGSVFSARERLEQFLKNPDVEILKNDPAYRLFNEALEIRNGYAPLLQDVYGQYGRAHRLYIAGLMEMDPGRKFYPDANSTMRLTYGRIEGYRPSDGMLCDYRTTLDGVISKENPENPYEFSVPDRLKTLHAAKDYGPYGADGTLYVNFLSNNDITGGNSGSPVLNARGELIGVAFDGNWEAMTSNIAYNAALQRTISVDIRYVLFIVDKFAGAKHLLGEMTIVR